MPGPGATGPADVVVRGLPTAAGVRRDDAGSGLTEVATLAAALVAPLMLPCAVRARPPAVIAARPTTSTALPAMGLPNRAQRTCPRAIASAPTARANSPNAIVAPLEPSLRAPIRTMSARPAKPIESATVNLRRDAPAWCHIHDGRTTVIFGIPGARCSARTSPPRYPCGSSGCGDQPVGRRGFQPEGACRSGCGYHPAGSCGFQPDG